MTEPTWKDPLLAKWATLFPVAARNLAGTNISDAVEALLWAEHHASQDSATTLAALIDAELARGREALGMKHVWIPVSECGELADGEYRVLVMHGFGAEARQRQQTRTVENGAFRLCIGAEVTHVLSPSLGPIPEGTR